MPKPRNKRRSVFICLLLVSLLLLGRGWRQTLLNHALIAAIHQNHAPVVQSLLHAGADPNARESEAFPASLRCWLYSLLGRRTTPLPSDTALSLACYHGREWNKRNGTISRPNEEIVLALLNAGARPDLHGSRSEAPLMSAVRMYPPVLVQALLKHHADVHIKDAFGYTPLQEACDIANTQAAELLLKAGAAINAPDPKGDTPLMIARRQCDRDSAATLELLLDCHADTNIRDKEGHTVLQQARAQSATEVVELLKQAGATE